MLLFISRILRREFARQMCEIHWQRSARPICTALTQLRELQSVFKIVAKSRLNVRVEVPSSQLASRRTKQPNEQSRLNLKKKTIAPRVSINDRLLGFARATNLPSQYRTPGLEALLRPHAIPNNRRQALWASKRRGSQRVRSPPQEASACTPWLCIRCNCIALI